jgi:(S)-2-hydroxyglutarate dehydrogenase
MRRDRADLVVVGAGIVGLAVARAFSEEDPDARICVVDKESSVARHQTGRNSGVIHAGLYYPPGSLKAQLCREGRHLLIAYAEERGIPYRLPGKLVVALDESELPRLDELANRGRTNGISGLRALDADEMREIEPHVAGIRAIHVPETGIIDYQRVAIAFADDVRSCGGEVLLGSPVSGIETRARECVVQLASGDAIAARKVVVCTGVQSDRLARLTGVDEGRYRVAPFRGDYFELSAGARALVNGLVYPVPDPSFPFLGVHFTPRMNGEVWAGPNAVPSFHREGYGRASIRLRDAWELVGYPGTWHLARRYWRTGGVEIWRAAVKRAAVANMRRYLPALTGNDVTAGSCGIRAQVLARDGSLLDDFLFERRGPVLHVINAPSPAATASMAIARRIGSELRSGG